MSRSGKMLVRTDTGVVPLLVEERGERCVAEIVRRLPK
jgi:hypothetical protein